MTKYGFDLDGTLTKPAIAQLANDLFDAGHEIYVITGGLADTGEWTEEARQKLLESLGVRYTEIVRCLAPTLAEIAQIKNQACKERNIILMIDDWDIYLNAIEAQTLKVL